MKTTILFLAIISAASVTDALFLPYIYRALGITEKPQIPAPVFNRQGIPPYPIQRGPPPVNPQQAAPAQQPIPAKFPEQATPANQPTPARFAVFRTQQIVQSPWYPSTYKGYEGYVPYSSYLLPQVQAEIPIHPGEVQKVDDKEIENSPIIVGSGYAFHQSE